MQVHLFKREGDQRCYRIARQPLSPMRSTQCKPDFPASMSQVDVQQRTVPTTEPVA
jgi:hypothetical protein